LKCLKFYRLRRNVNTQAYGIEHMFIDSESIILRQTMLQLKASHGIPDGE